MADHYGSASGVQYENPRRGTDRSRNGIVLGCTGYLLKKGGGGLNGPATVLLVLYQNPRQGTKRSRNGTKILIGGLNGPATVRKSSFLHQCK